LHGKCTNIKQHPYYKYECNKDKSLLDIKKVNYSVLGLVGHWGQNVRIADLEVVTAGEQAMGETNF
jgi:hypothetical protein